MRNLTLLLVYLKLSILRIVHYFARTLDAVLQLTTLPVNTHDQCYLSLNSDCIWLGKFLCAFLLLYFLINSLMIAMLSSSVSFKISSSQLTPYYLKPLGTKSMHTTKSLLANLNIYTLFISKYVLKTKHSQKSQWKVMSCYGKSRY